MASIEPGANVTLIDKGSTFEIWRGAKGVMRLDWNGTKAVRIFCQGYGHAEFVPPILKRLEEAARTSGQFMQVCDWWDLDTYHSSFRTEHGSWIASHMHQWAGAHVLQRSKLVKMGLTVANLALNNRINTIDSRTEFEVIARKLGFSAPPSIPK